jgi:hypothetical protein
VCLSLARFSTFTGSLSSPRRFSSAALVNPLLLAPVVATMCVIVDA